MYIIQALYRGGAIIFEKRTFDVVYALKCARDEVAENTYLEGDGVRVITEEGHVVWESAEGL